MKFIKSSLMLIFVATALFSCNTQKSENQTAENVISDEIQVYYFHNTKRCVTCNAVENETRVALEMFYEKEMKSGTIAFTSLNLEEDAGIEMAQSLQVSGQTLIVVKGASRVNLTSEGFMNARSNPTKFHDILKAEIDNLL